MNLNFACKPEDSIKYFLSCFLVVFIFHYVEASDDCPANMHFSWCRTSCPLTCRNYRHPPLFCNLRCNAGCQCNRGYVLKRGQCIRPEQCRRRWRDYSRKDDECPENMHYNWCGSSCPLTCENYKDAPLMCNRKCNAGCECNESYVLKGGRCVKTDQCPSTNTSEDVQCPENMHFKPCGTSCPRTCENYKEEALICDRRCNPECQCDEGYVLKDGKCVKPEQCPSTNNTSEDAQCPENMHFKPCGTSCPRTCENYKEEALVCDRRCNPECQCDEGYVLKDSKCVKPEQCQSNSEDEQCPENMVFKSCGTSCPLTCQNYEEGAVVCDRRCNPECQCKDGYVLKEGKCIKPEDCDKWVWT